MCFSLQLTCRSSERAYAEREGYKHFAPPEQGISPQRKRLFGQNQLEIAILHLICYSAPINTEGTLSCRGFPQFPE